MGKLHYIVRSPWEDGGLRAAQWMGMAFPLGPPGCPSWGTFGAREAQLSTAAGGRLIFFAPFPSSIISGTHRSDMQVPFVRFLALAGSTTTSRASR